MPPHLAGFLIFHSWILLQYGMLFFKLGFEVAWFNKELQTQFSLWSTTFFTYSNTKCYVYSPSAKLWSFNLANRIGQAGMKGLLKGWRLLSPVFLVNSSNVSSEIFLKAWRKDLWVYDWRKSMWGSTEVISKYSLTTYCFTCMFHVSSNISDMKATKCNDQKEISAHSQWKSRTRYLRESFRT